MSQPDPSTEGAGTEVEGMQGVEGTQPDGEPAPAAPVQFTLSADEAVAVAEVTAAFAKAVPPGREQPYLELVNAAQDNQLTGAHVDTLTRVCVLALETGKARQLGKAETEGLINAVYRRTPAGKALASEAADVNRMLAQFAGKSIQSIRITCRMPGRYQLDLTVDGIDVAIAIEPEGLEVRSLQTG